MWGSHNPPSRGLFSFGFSLSGASLLVRGFHTFIKSVSFSSQRMWDLTIHTLAIISFSNQSGTSQSTPFGAPRPTAFVHPLWLSISLLAHRPVSGSATKQPKPTASRYYPLWALTFRASLKIFKKSQLVRGFHNLVKGVSFYP